MDSPIPFLMSELIQKLTIDDTTKGVGKNGAAVKENGKENLHALFLD